MLKHRNIDRICCWVLVCTVLLAGCYLGAGAAGLIASDRTIGYENRLFDTSRVHTLDIVMEDWDGFLATCTDEEYTACHVVIDGESYKNVAIRAKGNTSLSSVQQYGNNRYSFKIEFDHYQPGNSYHGLDKLSLNNLIQDNTYLKDYFAYTLMRKGGAASPLCSFVQINVNGQPWGLYLAVEAVEDSFLRRNYGNEAGQLYKPDSMSFGGGRGNGRGFDMEDFRRELEENGDGAATQATHQVSSQGMSWNETGDAADPGGFTPPSFDPGSFGGGRGGFGGGRGSADVMLQYIDDDPASYSNIFDNAKTEGTEADQSRLIASLKALSAGDTSVVDTDAVLRYLAVHNFLCNDDSYTGAMVHNYYLYEENGVLSMLPWDYNLAFGGFGMGGGFGTSGATGTVNQPIDSPVTSGDISSRPMVAWIFDSQETTDAYHEAYRQFIDAAFTSGWFEEELNRVTALIAPYVEQDPTAFCTYEEFQTGVETLRQFCLLRAQSVQGQLEGTIPATSQAQRNASTLVDASHLTLSDMGSMGNMGGGGDRSGGRSGEGERNERRPGWDGSADAERRRPDGGAREQQEETVPATDLLQPVPAEMPAQPGPGDASGQPQPPTASEAGFAPPGTVSARPAADVAPAAANASGALLVAVCAAVLLAALLFAARFRSHR